MSGNKNLKRAGAAHDTVRTFGVLFEDVSVEQAALRCARAATSWGGCVSVFVTPDSRVVAVLPRTAAEREHEKDATCIGVYQIEGPNTQNNQRMHKARQLIADDIWHHMQQAKAA